MKKHLKELGDMDISMQSQQKATKSRVSPSKTKNLKITCFVRKLFLLKLNLANFIISEVVTSDLQDNFLSQVKI